MADDNGQSNRDELEAAWTGRLRQDIGAALTPEEGEFRSRRAQIMAQVRAEQAGGSKPLAFPGPTEQRRRPRSFSPAWAGTLAASLVALVVVGVLFLVIFGSSVSSPTAVFQVSKPQATATRSASEAAAPASDAAQSGANAGSALANATAARNVPTSAAAATTLAAAAPPAGAAAGAATTAAATTAVATTKAATIAATGGTTAAASGGAAGPQATPRPANVPSATLLPATPGAAVAESRNLPLPVYSNTLSLALGSGQGVGFFLANQLQFSTSDKDARQQQGLPENGLPHYNYQGWKLSGARLEELVEFYQAEAVRQGYKLEGLTTLQNDGRLRVRWLYLSKGSDRLGVLIVESNDDDAAGSLKLAKGETGIFFATPT